jgi:hypothetical protein
MKWTSNEIAILGVTATLLVALLSALAAYLSSKRERRRILYSEAVQAILGWKEMLYRVRRRQKDQEPDLVEGFHDLQDKLTYYQAWIGSESKYMSRSYARLVSSVKGATEGLITEAWNSPLRVPPGNAEPGDVNPNIEPLIDRFLVDVRSHLSPFVWRKSAVAFRNWEDILI